MKRIFVILITLVIMLSGCGGRQSDPLAYQSYPLSAAGTLTCGDLSCCVRITLSEKGRAKISIESPETLSGYSFEVDKEEVWVYYDDMQIPLSKNPVKGIASVCDMLSIDGECYIDTYNDMIDGVNTCYSVFRTDAADITVYTEAGKETPYRIDYEGGDQLLRFDISLANTKTTNT